MGWIKIILIGWAAQWVGFGLGPASAESRYEQLPSIVHLLLDETRMWANAQRDGRPAEYRRRPLFNATKFG